jgi:hypothetical protein
MAGVTEGRSAFRLSTISSGSRTKKSLENLRDQPSHCHPRASSVTATAKDLSGRTGRSRTISLSLSAPVNLAELLYCTPSVSFYLSLVQRQIKRNGCIQRQIKRNEWSIVLYVTLLSRGPALLSAPN